MADIIVTDVTPRIQYTAGGGSPTVFSYPFPIFADTDLNVYLTPVGDVPDDVTQILVYNVDYTVTNSAPPTVGGTITLTTGATSGDVITIVRNQPDDRLNNYIDGGLFEATDVNTDFDRTVFMAQQNKMYDQNLGLHYNVCAQPVIIQDTVLPVLGPNEVWVKDNAGTAITTYDITGGGGGSVVNSVTGVANQTSISPTSGNVIAGLASNAIMPGTGGLTLPQGNTAARAGGQGTLRFNTQTALFEITVDGAAWQTISTSSGTVTNVTASSPLASSGGTTPNISLTGIVPVANGGTGTSTVFTSGSVIFAGASGVYNQDNANFFWDDTNNRLGIGTASPGYDVHVSRSATGSAVTMRVQNTESTNANSDAHIWARTATGGGNPHYVAQIDSAQAYAWGIDQADSSKFKLSRSTNLATNTVLTITSAGASTFAGSLSADSLTLTNPLAVTSGGTGLSTATTAYGVVCAGTVATGAFQVLNSLGTAGQVLTSNGAGVLPSWQAGGSGSGVATVQSVSQAAHGFAVGDVVYLNSTTYTKAIATSTAAAEAVGIVSAVADADNFSLLMEGYITGLSGLTAGTVYYLSDSVAGALTATAPTTVGYVVKPLLVAATTAAGVFVNYRGNEITSSPGTGTSASLNYVGTTNTINASKNITSVTDNGTGDYTVNFTSNFANANYIFTGAGQYNTGSSGNFIVVGARNAATPLTVSSTRLWIFDGVGVLYDAPLVTVAWFAS